ncbi:MAG: hypothetical protein OXU37_02265 [Thaumarchaeota archaeon]|nr:hypothetical protein [Nitrososphaerota archaeon]MDD9813088.1 hypothetical protein [Nitrososphaerota archaeon]MDD9843181.1 hypothetical protein [Nitrososphaerota archaeon]RNJ71611.1 MAG: hypothetical protein EB833_06730 [Thaumarchaeota archaeon S13]RNJ73186.1 MAG: hypothetical protein EB832_02380 [Thaumarchaeota archaeon S14]
MRRVTLAAALGASAALIAAGIAIAVVPGALAPGGEPAEPRLGLPGNFGVIVNTPSREASVLELDSLYARAAALGAARSNVYVFWNALEPLPRSYEWAQTDAIMTMHERHGMAATLFFSLVNGRTLGPLPDWMGSPTLDAVPAADVTAALRAALTRYPRIDTVVIAGDADSHFERYPGMLDAYNGLFGEVREGLADSHPGVMVGNAVSLDRIINRGGGAIVEELAHGDFVAFTYRPVNLLNEVSRTPQGAMEDMREMLRLAGGRQVALLEAGWTSSGDVGGSEADQAEFAAALAGLAASEPSVEFVTWYRMHDREAGTCEVSVPDAGGSLLATDDGEYSATALGSYVCGAGLLRADGSPKPSWEALASR